MKKTLFLFLLLTIMKHKVYAEESKEVASVPSVTAAIDAVRNPEIVWSDILGTARKDHQEGRFVDVAALRAQLQKCIAAVANEEGAAHMIRSYLEFIRSRYPDFLGAEAAAFMANSSRQIQILAEGMLRCSRLKNKPIEMVFTALDGQKIDLKKLRGKVV